MPPRAGQALLSKECSCHPIYRALVWFGRLIGGSCDQVMWGGHLGRSLFSYSFLKICSQGSLKCIAAGEVQASPLSIQQCLEVNLFRPVLLPLKQTLRLTDRCQACLDCCLVEKISDMVMSFHYIPNCRRQGNSCQGSQRGTCIDWFGI